MTRNIIALLYQEIYLQIKRKTEWVALLLYFIVVIVLIPFALGPDPNVLSRLAPGFIWIAALLMSLLSLDRLFIQDARDGTLDEMLVSLMPLTVIIFIKVLAHITVMVVVLSLIALPAAFLLGMNLSVLPILILTFVLGIPILGFLGGIIGAVTVTLSRGVALMTLLLIPFYIPVLIFATSACDASISGGPALRQPLLYLAAFLALILPIAPIIIATVLRYGQE